MTDDIQKHEADQREFYPNRPLAVTAANRGQKEYLDRGCYSVTVQFEPGKGYLAVLFCENNIPEAWEAGFEVQTRAQTQAVAKTPTDWAKPAKPKAQPRDPNAPAGAPARPKGGTTARVWAIADEVGPDRAAIIAACVAEGINKATASTQYSKWKKARQ